MLAFAENFHAITQERVAPAMTMEGYRPSQNAGGLFLVNLPKETSVDNAAAQESMFSSEERPVSLSQLQDSEKDWTTLVATSCSPTLQLLTNIGPSGWFGRTSPAYFPLTEDETLPASFEGWQNSGMGSPTEFLTLSTSEWPSAAAVCSLSDILEGGNVPQRFFLSATACKGILRRAEKRGKALPIALQIALQSVAQAVQTRPEAQPTSYPQPLAL